MAGPIDLGITLKPLGSDPLGQGEENKQGLQPATPGISLAPLGKPVGSGGRVVNFSGPNKEWTDQAFTGFGGDATQPPQDFWGAVKQGASEAFQWSLSLFTPLLYAGDVTRAVIYGAATGGAGEAAKLGWEQAKQILNYLPGQKPKTMVTGDDLARVMLPGYSQMPEWQKMGTSFLMEVATDPLTVFGAVGAVSRGASIATRTAKVLTPVTRGLEGVAQAASAVDKVANAALNPFSQLGAAARAVGHIPLNDEGKRVADLTGNVLSGILNFKLLNQTVRLPEGKYYASPVRLVDFFDAFGTPKEHQDVWSKLERLTGGPEYGGSAIARARDEALGLQRLTMSYVEDLQKIVHDSLGEEVNLFGIAKRNVIKPEAMPVYNVIKEQTQRIIDQYGVVGAAPEVAKASGIVKQVAKGVGVDEGAASKAFQRYFDTAQAMYADLTYRYSGVDLYKKFFFDVAQKKGVDAEEAWNRYMAIRTGGILAEQKRGALAVKPAPDVITPSSFKIPDSAVESGKKMLDNADAAGKDATYKLRMLLSLPATEQLPLLQKYPDLAKTYGEYATAVNDFTKYVKSINIPDLDKVKGYAETVFGGPGRGTFGEEVIDTIIREQDKPFANIPALWHAVDMLSEKISPDGVMDLLSTPVKGNKEPWQNVLGFLTIGRGFEKQGDYQTALAFHSMAASLAAKHADEGARPMASIARHLYANGAVVDRDAAEALASVGPYSSKSILQAVAAQDLSKDVVTALGNAAEVTPVGFRNDVLKELAKFNTPAAKLAANILTKNTGGVKDILTDALQGRISADKEGIQALVDLSRKVLGDDGLHDTLKGLGLAPDNIDKWRSQFPDVLEQINKEALKRWWIERPHWAGIADPESLLGGVTKEGKWVGAPQSPLQYFENLRNGYARRTYFGLENPDAAAAALMKGAIHLIPEIDEAGLNAAKKALVANGQNPQAVNAALGAFAKYVNDTSGQAAYNIEPILAIFKANGLQLDQKTFNGVVAKVLGFDKAADNAQVAIQQAKDGLMKPSVPLFAERPEAFAARVDNAEALVRIMDPEASAGSFARAASRSVLTSTLRNETYKALSDAGLILDEPPPAHVLSSWAMLGDASKTRLVEPTGETLPYGPLQGKYIPRPVYNWLLRTLSVQPMSEGAAASFLSFWRKALLNNPRTAIVNGVGNYFLMWANMGEKFATEAVGQTPTAMRLLHQYYNTGQLPDEMQGAVHFLHEVNLGSEMRKATDRAVTTLLNENPDLYTKGAVERVIEKLDTYTNHFGQQIANALGKEKDPYIKMLSPIEMFAYMENVARVSAYLAARKLGSDVPEALWKSTNAIFDYSQVPFGLQMIRNYGVLPFPAFIYFTAKAGLKWTVDRPAVYNIPQHLSQSSFYAGTDSPDDHARIYTYMPDWLKTSMPMVTPVRHSDGSYTVIPLTSVLPLRPFDSGFLSDVLGFGAYGPLIDAAAGIINYYQNPLAEGKPLLGQKSGDRLYPGLSTQGEAIRGSLDYAARQYLPTWMTRFFPVTDAPELKALKENGKDNASELLNVRSLLGRTIARYTNPQLVAFAERERQKALGFSLPEAAVGLLATPRVVSPNPFGITSGGTIGGLLNEVQQLNTELAKGNKDYRALADLQKRRDALVEEARKKLEPFLKLNQMFGPTPELPPVQNPFEGR